MPGPGSTDSNFERTFADLAYARLRDKAPSMLDYLIGFQLIDKNEEETHAIGVFGFKVGSEWVYAPVFFLNGELKGHELMYIKSQDSFVPMVEQWVNYILNRRPPVLGEGETTPRSKLPIRGPDFEVFATAPGGKSASDQHCFQKICARIRSEFLPFMHNFQVDPTGEKYAHLNGNFSLPTVLKAMGKKAAYVLVNTMKNDEKFAEAILKFYDIKDLINFEAAPAPARVKAASVKRLVLKDNPLAPKVAAEHEIEDKLDEAGRDMRKGETTDPKVIVVVRGDDMSNVMVDMTEEEKKKLIKDQYVVRDSRGEKQTTVVYKSQVGQSLTNPTENGYYEILTSAGDRKEMLIITSPRQIGGYENEFVVIDVKGKRVGTFNPRDIMVSKRLETGEWDKAFGSFTSPDSLKNDDVAVIVGPKGDGTMPFRITEKFTDGDGRTQFRVYKHYCGGCRGGSAMPATGLKYQRSDDNTYIDRIILTGKDAGMITYIGSTMFVPNKYKAMRFGSEFKNELCSVDLGSMADVVLKLFKSAEARDQGIRTFQLRTDGLSFFPCLDGVQTRAMSKLATFKHLIVGLGMTQDDAEYLLKQAQPRKAETYVLKLAYGLQPGTGEFPEPEVTSDPNFRAPVQYDMSSTQNIGQLDSSYGQSFYNDDRSIDDATKQYAQQAANTGQKEILDTAVISGLVRTMDTDSAVDGYIGDLLLGLDRVGRILFMYYWHNDKFKERYGQQDMIELEDNLRNVFKTLGELGLFLKQKTIEPDQADSSEVQLTDVIG